MDFSSLKYRIDLIPEEEKCITHFPELMELAHVFDNSSDLPPDVTADKVLRYLIYMYDPKTPLSIQIPDLKKRKSMALKLINIDTNDAGEVSQGYNELCCLNATWAIQRFVHFCMLHDTGNLLSAHTNFEVMHQLTEKLLLDVKQGRPTDLKILRNEIDEARIAFEQALDRMLVNETNMKNIDYVKFTIRQNTLGIRPEEYIREYANRGDVFSSSII